MTAQRWTVGEVTITSVVEEQTEHIPPEFFFPDATRGGRRAARLARARLRGRRRQARLARAGVRDRDAPAPRAGRPVRRQRQEAADAVLERAHVPVHGALRGRRLRSARDRHGRAHAPARRPRRLGHAARRGRVAADVRERAPPLHRARARVLPRRTTTPASTGVYADSVAPIFAAGLADDRRRGRGSRRRPAARAEHRAHARPRLAVDRVGGRGRRSSPATSCTTRCSARSPAWPRSAISTSSRRAPRAGACSRARASGGALFLGTHFATRPAGRVEPYGDAFRFVPVA